MGILKPGAAGKVGWLTGMAGTPIFPYFRYFFSTPVTLAACQTIVFSPLNLDLYRLRMNFLAGGSQY